MPQSKYFIEQRGFDFLVYIKQRKANKEGDFKTYVNTFSTFEDAENYITRQETKPSSIISDGKWVSTVYNDQGLVCSSFWSPDNLLHYVIAILINTERLSGAKYDWRLRIYNSSSVKTIDNIEESYELIDSKYRGCEGSYLMKNVCTDGLELYTSKDQNTNDGNAPVLYYKGTRLVFVRFEK